MIADDRALNDLHEATDAMTDAFIEIWRAAGLSTELTEIDMAMAQATAMH